LHNPSRYYVVFFKEWIYGKLCKKLIIKEVKMEIANNTVVSIEFELTDENGELLDKSTPGQPLIYIQGAQSMVPGLEAALEGKAIGADLEVTLEPTEGYGMVSDELFQEVPKDQFEGVEELKVGMEFQAQTNNGVQIVSISEVKDEVVVINGNHPLAGKTLNFEVKVVDVREATPEELDSGHIHSTSCGCGH
jgi:FKBP-type peptidyl-prolyl cis-trans isomerase SlyD